MRTTNKCVNCAKSIQYGVNSNGQISYQCKQIFCIFEPIIENPYHTEVLNFIVSKIKQE